MSARLRPAPDGLTELIGDLKRQLSALSRPRRSSRRAAEELFRSCIRMEVERFLRRLRDLKDDLEIDQLDEQNSELIHLVLSALESGDMTERVYRYVWLIEGTEPLFPSDGTWKEYFDRTRGMLEARRIMGVRCLLVPRRDVPTDRLRSIWGEVRNTPGYECRVLTVDEYRDCCRRQRWLDGFEDFGVFGSALLFRTKAYYADDAKTAARIRGVFSRGDAVAMAVRAFDDCFWSGALGVSLDGEDPVPLGQLEEADEARRFVGRLRVPFGEHEMRAARQVLGELHDAAETRMREVIRRNLAGAQGDGWEDRLRELVLADRRADLEGLAGAPLMNALYWSDCSEIVKRSLDVDRGRLFAAFTRGGPKAVKRVLHLANEARRFPAHAKPINRGEFMRYLDVYEELAELITAEASRLGEERS